jgi:hypothetical protein
MEITCNFKCLSKLNLFQIDQKYPKSVYERIYEQLEIDTVTIFSNGTMYLNMPLVYNGYCIIYAQFYPFDAHTCYIFGYHSQG